MLAGWCCQQVGAGRAAGRPLIHVLPTDLVTRNRQVAEAALRPWTPVFTHGDLQITHVFVDGDEVRGSAG